MDMKLLIKVRVEAIVAETERIKRFILRPAERPEFPDFAPGDHIFVVLPNGLRRPYSLCSDPFDTSLWEFAVLRKEAGLGGSVCLHDQILVGDTLLVTYPQRGLGLSRNTDKHIFVAGGIGITPFIPMVHALGREGRAFELNYCARAPDAATFDRVLSTLSAHGVLHRWYGPGHGGHLDLVARFAVPEPNTHLYCCGPAGMIDAFLAATRAWPPEAVHVERFIGPGAEEARHGGSVRHQGRLDH